ncbi:MAG TPA: hypothetical protein VII82_14800 [Polyangiaceae bacterium]
MSSALRPRSLLAASVALAGLVGVGRDARAQGNDRSAPTGGRSALMGNTGVALARDGAAPFINPATIVGIDDQRLAFSVNFFTYSLRHFSRWNEPGPVDPSKFGNVALDTPSDSSTRFQALPSTLCLFFTLSGITPLGDDDAPAPGARKGRQKLAFCLGTLESDSVNLTALQFHGQTSAGATSQVESISRNWNRIYVGPTYGIELTDHLALGLSLHGVVTSDSFVVEGSSISTLVGGTALQTGLGTEGYGYSFDLLANVGATYKIGKLTFGADGQLPSLHGLGKLQVTAHDDTGGASGTSDLETATGSFRAPPPIRLAVGAGYEWPRLTVEVDGSLEFPWSTALSSTLNVTSIHLANGASTTSSATQTPLVGTRSMVNAAIGAEYFIRPSLSLIGGAYSNISAIHPLEASQSVGNLVQARTNHLGISFGIGSYGHSADVLIGTQLDFGWGDALVVNPYMVPNDWTVIRTQVYSAVLVLAGTTDLRAIGHAVDKIEKAVTTGNPDNAAAPAPLPPPKTAPPEVPIPTPRKEPPLTPPAAPPSTEPSPQRPPQAAPQ